MNDDIFTILSVRLQLTRDRLIPSGERLIPASLKIVQTLRLSISSLISVPSASSVIELPLQLNITDIIKCYDWITESKYRIQFRLIHLRT